MTQKINTEVSSFIQANLDYKCVAVADTYAYIPFKRTR